MSYSNPTGRFRNLSGSRGNVPDKPSVTWADVAEPCDIGDFVLRMTDEGVRVAFNRTRARTALIVTLTADGETHNVFVETKAEWQQLLKDLLTD
jgi:hypothetical protein